jgi:hypothetical protein
MQREASPRRDPLPFLPGSRSVVLEAPAQASAILQGVAIASEGTDPKVETPDRSALFGDPNRLVIQAFYPLPTALVEGLKRETISVIYSDAGQATVIYENLGGSMDDSVSSFRYVSILELEGELWRLKQVKKQWFISDRSSPPTRRSQRIHCCLPLS